MNDLAAAFHKAFALIGGLDAELREIVLLSLSVSLSGVPPAKSGRRREHRQILELSNRGSIVLLIGNDGHELTIRTH